VPLDSSLSFYFISYISPLDSSLSFYFISYISPLDSSLSLYFISSIPPLDSSLSFYFISSIPPLDSSAFSTSSAQFDRWIQASSLFHVFNLTVGFKPTNCNTFFLVGRSEPLNLDLKVAVLIASFVKSEPLDQKP
jgi:hypothetical protein